MDTRVVPLIGPRPQIPYRSSFAMTLLVPKSIACGYSRAIAYEKSGRWFTAEEPLLRAKERTDAGSSAFRHPRSELIAPLPQEAAPAFNNRKLHMRLPWVTGRCLAAQLP